MLQQFLRTASDGWELALTSVRNLFAEADLYADEVGGDFAAEAQRLGEAVARIHTLLAEHFPTVERTAADHGALADAMTAARRGARRRTGAGAARADLRDLFAAVGAIGPDTAQRVHGDLHLGQTLRTAKGWKIVDFEGEPAKPLAERVLPDSPWRDVAGMLRSFDYAPRVGAMTAAATGDNGSEQRAYRAAEWSARNQAAFLEAYAGGELTDDEQTLLAAYVADKAVYECVYEARNRPAWLSIPMAALASRLPRTEEEPMKQVPTSEIQQLIRGEHGQPHAILGPHPDGDGVTIRSFKPLARSVTAVLADGTRVPLEHEYEGVWVGEWVPVVSRRAQSALLNHRLTARASPPASTCRTTGSRWTTGRARSPSTTRTGSCRPSARSTCTWSTRGGTSCCGPCSARGSTTTAPRPATSRGRRSRSGRRVRAASGWRATSTAGTAASTRCASSASRACGSCSCRASGPAPATST